MCEANVYIQREGREELLMEKVDHIVPGEENNLFLENIFGERKVIQARIKEMQLVHHRIIVEEILLQPSIPNEEIWITLDTNHGHFHPGEEIVLKLYKGYNMKPGLKENLSNPKVYVLYEGKPVERDVIVVDNSGEINLGKETEGLIRVYAHEAGDHERYSVILVEVGHHHHHGVEAIGLPLEILPARYQHARMGDNYEIQVMRNGKPLANAKVRATYEGTSHTDYPHMLVTDAEGKASLFLTARGNYLFSVQDENIISTFTLVKSF